MGDAVVVEQLARIDTRYLGMLGRRRKVALTWKLLEEQGISRARLDQIHAPVGLSIGADTPEEIAISVVAYELSRPATWPGATISTSTSCAAAAMAASTLAGALLALAARSASSIAM